MIQTTNSSSNQWSGLGPEGTPVTTQPRYSSGGLLSSPRRVILLAAGVISLVLLVLIFITLLGYGWINITVAATDSNEPAKITVSRGEETLSSFTLAPGASKKIFVKKGHVRIDSAVGNRKGINVGTVRSLKTTQATATPGTQYAITKIGSYAGLCGISVAGKAYSYSCNGHGEILRHTTAISPESVVTSEPISELEFSSLQPYKNGLIGIIEGEGNEQGSHVVYVDLTTETVTRFAVPDELKQVDESGDDTIITSDDPASSGFLIKYRFVDKLYYVSDFTNPKITNIPLPANIKFSDDSLNYAIQLPKEGPFLYLGPPNANTHEDAIPTENEEHAESNSQPKTTIQPTFYQYDFSGRITRSLPAPNEKDVSPINMFKLPKNFYVASVPSIGKAFYYYDGTSMKPVINLPEAAAPVMYGDKAYFQTNGTAYEFTPGDDGLFSLRSVFSSPAVSVSEIQASRGGITFTGFAKRSVDPLPRDLYRLETKHQTTPPVEEQIPFDKVSKFTQSYDYDDTKVLFTLKVTSSADYFTLKDRLAQRLEKEGINLGKRTLELNSLN